MTNLKHIQTSIRALVQSHFDTQNSAAESVALYWSGKGLDDTSVDYGGWSHKMKGTRPWSVNDLVALMAITGCSTPLRVIANGLERGQAAPDVDPMEQAAKAAKEAGEAVAAAVRGDDDAVIIQEATEAEIAMRDIRVSAQARVRRKMEGAA